MFSRRSFLSFSPFALLPTLTPKVPLKFTMGHVTIEVLTSQGNNLINWKEISESGTKWIRLKQLHRTDGPAYERADGYKAWYLNGQLHRTDGPTVECANGDKYWYLNGKLHRTDGPAIEYADGAKAWLLNGQYHREDGPAIERADGYKAWYLNGQLSRFQSLRTCGYFQK